MSRKEHSRREVTKEDLERMYHYEKLGLPASEIAGILKLGYSTVKAHLLIGRDIENGLFNQALKRMGVYKASRLTNYAIEKIFLICDAKGIERPSRDYLKYLQKHPDGTYEDFLGKPEQIEFCADVVESTDLKTFVEDLKNKLDHNSIQEVIDFINDQYNKYNENNN